METKELRCTHCGAPLTIDNEDTKVVICKYCGKSIIVDRGLDFAKRVEELHLEEETKELNNYRTLLSKAILETQNKENIIELCNKILDILPNDFEASFYQHFAKRANDTRNYENFIKTIIQNYNVEEFKPYLSYMITYASFYELEYIKNLISQIELEDEVKTAFNNEISKRKERLDEESDLYANIKRDIFICHSSKDEELLNAIVYHLEDGDGFRAWYSERNMPKDNDDYWKVITQAIENCDVFLLLITENAKFSKDVKEELSIARKLNKQKVVAVNVSLENPGIEFKEFLSRTGSQWIEATDDNAFGILSKRIYDFTHKEDNNQSYNTKENISDKNEKEDNQEKNTNNTNSKKLSLKDFIGTKITEGKEKVASFVSPAFDSVSDAMDNIKNKIESSLNNSNDKNSNNKSEKNNNAIVKKTEANPVSVLVEDLSKCSNNKKKVKKIRQFTLQNNKYIYDLAKIASENIDIKEYNTASSKENVSLAWYEKLEMCVQKIKIEPTEHDEEINELYNKISEEIKTNSKSRKIVVILIIAALIISMFALIICNM